MAQSYKSFIRHTKLRAHYDLQLVF